jgi:hypothetical protein
MYQFYNLYKQPNHMADRVSSYELLNDLPKCLLQSSIIITI